MHLFLVLALAIIVSVFPAASRAESGVQPAKPIERAAPEYPEECRSAEAQSVEVIYDISSEGTTENIRVKGSTDECFEKAAVEAVRKWRFEPRMDNGTPSPQLDTVTRLIFVRQGPPTEELTTLKRLGHGAGYPLKCMRDAKDIEYVTFRYDISEAGIPENIRIVKSTNSCFNEVATKSLEKWRYVPGPVRTDVEVTLTFRLE